jgi:CRISPR-associated protein Csd1
MTMLLSLNKAYKRLERDGLAPSYGFSNQKICYVISLNSDGTPAGLPIDIRDISGKKPMPRMLPVPQPTKRTSGIAPNFLWDKTSYVLGVTAGENKRLKDEHKAFVDFHKKVLKGTQDVGLKAFLSFLDQWTEERFAELGWTEDMKDQNIIFILESERLQNKYLHDNSAAKQIWARLISSGDKVYSTCLVTGEKAPVARLHPGIKGVFGGQSSGGSIISFNLDAFTSYGHEQGSNAPVSEAAAFAYTTALNKFLEKGSKNRIQIGDASVVFWADASVAEEALKAEAAFGCFFGDEPQENAGDEKTDDTALAYNKIKPILERIRNGEPLSKIDHGLAEGVRFYILGLSPNAARISVRFWMEDSFDKIADNYQRFLQDMRVEDSDGKDKNVALWKYLRETAVQGKGENVPPLLAGQWARAILMGTPYPLSLISSVLMRIRSDGNVNVRRASILKSVIVRNFKLEKEAPVALDTENTNKGYLLGRLFAVYEHIQAAALGNNVNSTIKDKYYASASAQPRKVFGILQKGSVSHLSKIGKQKPGLRVNLDKYISYIMTLMSPGDDPYPAHFSSEQQALFGLGYYHQREDFFKTKSSEPIISEEK